MKHTHVRLFVCMTMIAIAAFALPGLGQDTPAEAPESAAAAPETDSGEQESGVRVLVLLKQGGALMWLLGLLSVATVALGVYGFMIARESKMLTPELVPSLQEALGGLDIERAKSICDGAPSLLTNVLNAGLQRISDGYLDVPSMDSAMEEAAIEESAAGLKTISYLSVIAQTAPMVGLLGTVFGMIGAFAHIGHGAMGKPEVLANDIGQALVTTAAGLMIGIPAMFLYFYLKGQYTSNVTRLGRIVGNLSHHLVATTRRGDQPPAAQEGQEPEE